MVGRIWSHISNKVTRNKVNQITLEFSSCRRSGLIPECVSVMLEGKRCVSISKSPSIDNYSFDYIHLLTNEDDFLSHEQ